ncbi:MAG: hypothetical protein COA94_02130 [Rickettsiales bacterium]|nr:MAG: hypothetical protein COA94_02130 [Rickettsiales bacterium]
MNFSKEEILVVTETTKTLVVPKGIKKLICSDIGLETLILNEGIVYVDCSCNRLTELIVPDSVITLSCYRNLLTKLIATNNVTSLSCSNNLLTELIVPNSVTTLHCYRNKITKLIIPSSVKYVICLCNPLEDLSGYNELIVPKVVSLYTMCHNAITSQDNIPSFFDLVDKVTCCSCKNKVVEDMSYIQFKGCNAGYVRKIIKCRKCYLDMGF